MGGGGRADGGGGGVDAQMFETLVLGVGAGERADGEGCVCRCSNV